MKTRTGNLMIGILMILIFATSIASNAQTQLFKGMKSGMTKTEVSSYVSSNDDFSTFEDAESFTTIIEGRKYFVVPLFNSSNKLKALYFSSYDTYEWMYYDPNVKENAVELFTILSVKYGEPTFNEWADWTDIPDGKSIPVCGFERGTVHANLYVEEDSDEYYVNLILSDERFMDKTVASSGGF